MEVKVEAKKLQMLEQENPKTLLLNIKYIEEEEVSLKRLVFPFIADWGALWVDHEDLLQNKRKRIEYFAGRAQTVFSTAEPTAETGEVRAGVIIFTPEYEPCAYNSPGTEVDRILNDERTWVFPECRYIDDPKSKEIKTFEKVPIEKVRTGDKPTYLVLFFGRPFHIPCNLEDYVDQYDFVKKELKKQWENFPEPLRAELLQDQIKFSNCMKMFPLQKDKKDL